MQKIKKVLFVKQKTSANANVFNQIYLLYLTGFYMSLQK